MTGVATLPGGGMTSLSPAERQAAQHALTKLQSRAGSLGSSLGSSTQSATVYSGSIHEAGVNRAGIGMATLMPGLGNDTFLGGARSASTMGIAHIGNDTVISGSAAVSGPGGRIETLTGLSGAQFHLTNDTINVTGATAANVHGGQPQDTPGTHTIMLADRTTITIVGVSPHDIPRY